MCNHDHRGKIMNRSTAAVAVRVLSGAVAFAMAGATFAADMPKEGTYDFTSCWGGTAKTIALSKKHAGFTYELSGETLSNPPGSMFDHSSFHCIGMGTVLAGKLKQTTICEAVDPEGNKSVTLYLVDGKHTTRTLLEGTGPYKDMVSTGTAEALGKTGHIKPGTFQACNRQTGTYKMKNGM